MTESNSVACGGDPGSSDTFAASLWSTDWLFMMAAAGLDGVDFHSTSPFYQPFSFGRNPDGTRFAFVRPIYYGMLLFAEATAHRSRLLRTTYPYPYQRGYNIHTWGTWDAVDRVVRVAVINKSGRAQPVRLKVRGAHQRGTLKRLSAPNLRATSGITWGGRAFGVPTDGTLTGRERLSRVDRSGRRTFRISMPRYGIALFSVRVGRR
jgi:hypothetical protein